MIVETLEKTERDKKNKIKKTLLKIGEATTNIVIPSLTIFYSSHFFFSKIFGRVITKSITYHNNTRFKYHKRDQDPL